MKCVTTLGGVVRPALWMHRMQKGNGAKRYDAMHALYVNLSVVAQQRS